MNKSLINSFRFLLITVFSFLLITVFSFLLIGSIGFAVWLFIRSLIEADPGIAAAVIGAAAAVIGALIALAGAIIVMAFNAFLEWKRTRKRATYLAARIICVLDEYIEKCCEVVLDDGTSMGQPAGLTEDGYEYYKPQVSRPEPPCYPDDVDWKSIENNLMYRILALPNHARNTDRYIVAVDQYDGPPYYEEVFYARQGGYANLGLEAIELTEALHEKYKIPNGGFKLNLDWDSKQYLKEQKDKIEERRARRLAASSLALEETIHHD